MKLIAVTACPTGIAHSQMAAESLEQAADAADHDIKVEVRGSMGTENELSNEDIDTADAVIIAADTAAGEDRFSNLPVVNVPVADAVNDATDLVAEAVEAADGTPVEIQQSQRQSEPTRRRGGDPEKSLLARLKRLFE